MPGPVASAATRVWTDVPEPAGATGFPFAHKARTNRCARPPPRRRSESIVRSWPGWALTSHCPALMPSARVVTATGPLPDEMDHFLSFKTIRR